ncbi:hypothetical protein ACIQNU_04625 [Streptomyces sp. NPDC091292]|uniref:hypothetical protein n=1 Tax=Streptomyces sp. NPDC091292 TaxID=3365991 RepID=UPI0038039918
MDDSQRYLLTLATEGRTAMRGWWPDPAVAERKFARWIGEYSGVEGARIVLTDEAEQQVLASWPDEPERLQD